MYFDEELLKEELYWAECEARGERDLKLKLEGLKQMNNEELIEELIDAVKEVIGQSENNEVLNVGTFERLVAIVGRIESEVEVEEGEES